MLRTSTSSEYERRLALRALSTAGSAEQRRAAVALTLERRENWGTRVVAESIDAFYPEHMSDEQLSTLIQTGDEQETRRATGLGWTLEQVATRAPVAAVERMLSAVMTLVRQQPYASEHVAVSRRYEWLVHSLATICEKLLPASGPPSDDLFDAVELLGKHAFWRGQVHVDTKQLSAVLDAAQLTRHFFWRTFTSVLERLQNDGIEFQDYWQFHREHPLWRLKSSDFEWLVADVTDQPTPEARRAALTAALNVWSSHGRGSSELATLRAAVQGDGRLRQILDEFLNPTPAPMGEGERQLQELREERQRESEETRRDAEQSWLEFRAQLQQNPIRLLPTEGVVGSSNFGDLWDICRWLRAKRGDHSRYGVGEWELLIPAFGQAVAESARDALCAFWRTIDCEAELQSDETTNGSIVALTGISIDARKPRWAISLTDEDARRATKIAFKELNALPKWLADIFEHKRGAADEVVRPLITSELALAPDDPSSTHILERLYYSPSGVRDRIPPIVLDELEEHDTRRPVTLRRALRLALALGGTARGDGRRSQTVARSGRCRL